MDAQDFSVDRLFRVSKKVLLGERVVVVKAFSDTEGELRDREAMIAAAHQRRALEDPGSPDYLLFVTPIQSRTEADLRIAVAILKGRFLEVQAQREIRPEYIPFPDGASDVEQQQVILAREDQAELVKERQRAFSKEKLATYTREVETKDHAWLIRECQYLNTEAACEAAYSKTWVFETIYRCCYQPDGETLFFASRAEAEKTPKSITDRLLETFREVNDLDPLALIGPPPTDS